MTQVSPSKRGTSGSLRDSLIASIQILTRVKNIIDAYRGSLPQTVYDEINTQLMQLIKHLTAYDNSVQQKQKTPITSQDLKNNDLRKYER
ncbi:MAG TPA: hypothetical protein V6C96_04295 [Vampirovibrionales bacterium]